MLRHDDEPKGRRLDTGQYFKKRSAQGLVFECILKGQESKVVAFLALKYSFGGPLKSEKCNIFKKPISNYFIKFKL